MASRSQPRVDRTISRTTRQHILDILTLENLRWSGTKNDPEFLGRVWDLSALPSTDSRFRDAAGDIWQHTVNNDDWPSDWLFGDDRFNLLGCADETFIKFLCEMVHPVVRPDAQEAEKLVGWFNEQLNRDAWQLVPVDRLRAQPIYAGRRRDMPIPPAAALDLDRYHRIDDPHLFIEHLRRIEASLAADPPVAIGHSKELVESTCKVILRDYGEDVGKSHDLPALYKAVQVHLKLRPEAVPESPNGSRAAEQTLRTLITTIQSLAELRNELGIGHGRDRRSPALARHARLAFHAAITISDFLLATWHVRRQRDAATGSSDPTM